MPTILIVEDCGDAAVMLAKLLELAGAETRTADNGVAALEVFAEFQPDIVILDLGLPELDGFEVCRRIRAQSDTLIVILSGYGQQDFKAKAIEAGANHYFLKPADVQQLIGLIHHEQTTRTQERSDSGHTRGATSGERCGDSEQVSCEASQSIPAPHSPNQEQGKRQSRRRKL